MHRREFMMLVGGQRFGRSQRTRNSARYRSLGSSFHRKPRPRNRGSRPLFSASASLVGSRVARSQLSIGGRRDAPSASPRSSPNSPDSELTSLSPRGRRRSLLQN